MAGGAGVVGRRALRDYGRELGYAFQLVDDVLDYRGEAGTLGKNIDDDEENDLPVILALGVATPANREIIVGALGNPEAGVTLAAGGGDLRALRYAGADHRKAFAHARHAREARSRCRRAK